MENIQNLKVVNNIKESRFEIRIDQHLAVSQYQLNGNTITYYHVGVPSELEGQGIGSLLAKAGLEYARENSLKVIPICPFVAAYIRRHPEYKSLT